MLYTAYNYKGETSAIVGTHKRCPYLTLVRNISHLLWVIWRKFAISLWDSNENVMDCSKCFSKSQCFLLWQILNKSLYLILSLLLNTYCIHLNHQTMCTMHPCILCTWYPFLKWFMTSLLIYHKKYFCIIKTKYPIGSKFACHDSWAELSCHDLQIYELLWRMFFYMSNMHFHKVLIMIS